MSVNVAGKTDVHNPPPATLRFGFIYKVAMLFSSTTLYFVLAYIGAVLLAVLSKRELREHPEKANRYKALPLAYKLACWLVVLPLMAATVVHGAFSFLGFVSFFLLDAACVRWYRRAGLY